MENQKKFVIEQLDEALEERQNPDRRKEDKGYAGPGMEDRRKYDRREASKNTDK